MALRQLLLTREMDTLNAEQAALMSAMSEIEARRSTWRERESRAEAALAEMNAETTAEEREAFDAECAEIQAEDTAIAADEEANQARQGEIAGRLAEIRTELEELEKRAKLSKTPAPVITNTITERGDIRIMNTRTMKIRERILATVGADGTRAFAANIVNLKNRGVTNAELGVPVELLPMLSEMIDDYSKLKKYVNARSTSGETRQNLMRGTPEAVWTESKASINELKLDFGQITVDAYKVAGFIPIDNSDIEDNNENLAALVLDAIARSIALAEDKAILYGDGIKRPVGIMTRLSAKTKPTWWGENDGEFVDLSATHIGKASSDTLKGLELFKEMATVLGRAKKKYNAPGDDLFWAMARPTWMKLTTRLLSFDSSGVLVSGMNMQMPLIGGDVVLLDGIMNENDIVGGYGSQYLWGDRTGTTLKVADQTRAIEDQTLFIGRKRADGKPMAGEGFAAFSLTTTAPQTNKTFAEDKANAAEAE